MAENSPRPARFQTITRADVQKLVTWIYEQDLQMHPDTMIVDKLLTAFDGFTRGDLRWLCAAIKQAGEVPAPSYMAKAIRARDVALLR